MAESLKKPLVQAKILHTTYWKRNAAVKKTAAACVVKEVNGRKWLYNPISKFWMYLKEEKDRFSTLNQSSGVYVFDSWLRKVRNKIAPRKVILQYHDELLLVCKKEDKEFVEKSLHEAMVETNREIKLNIEIKISTSWGNNYAECH
jgi:DNA polymerase I-like protein with 3'-5' exonuclease and polymerase domains